MKIKILLMLVLIFISSCGGSVSVDPDTRTTYHIETLDGDSLTVAYLHCAVESGQNSIIVSCYSNHEDWLALHPSHVYVATDFYVVETE